MSVVALPEFSSVMDTEPLLPPAGFPLSRLSPSSIDSFWKCAEQFRRDRLEPQLRPVTSEQLFGSAFHRSAERNLVQKIESEKDLPDAEMRDVTGDSFNEVVEEEKGTHEIVWGDSRPDRVQGEVIKAMVGTESLPGFHQVLAPTIQPLAVERWVEVDTPAGIPLVGRVDVETREGRIVDLKTSKRAKTQQDLDKSTQASAYLWARNAEGNPATGFSWATAIRTLRPQQQELTTERTSAELEAFERLIGVTIDTISHYAETYGVDGPWPGAPSLSWWCSPAQCSFYGKGCIWRP